MDKLVIRRPRSVPPPCDTRDQPQRWDNVNGMAAEVESETATTDTDDESANHFSIPLPLVMPLVGWSVALLWTSVRTAYRSRIDMMLQSFYQDVSFTLLRRHPRGLAARRLAEHDLKKVLFNNDWLASQVRSAAHRVTTSNPVVQMQRNEAILISRALQGPLSQVHAAEHMQAQTAPPGVWSETRFWYILTCSPTRFRVLTMHDETVDDLCTEVDDHLAADGDALALYTLGEVNNAAACAAARAVAQWRDEVKKTDTQEEGDLTTITPIIGSIIVPIPCSESLGGNQKLNDNTEVNLNSNILSRMTAAGTEEVTQSTSTVPLPVNSADSSEATMHEQAEWASALDAWEADTGAVLDDVKPRQPTTEGGPGLPRPK